MRYERTKIVGVAIRFRGKVYSLPAPKRHHDVIREILRQHLDATHVDAFDENGGFIDENGMYLTRKQAEVSAALNGQIKNGKLIGSVLTSEDLW